MLKTVCLAAVMAAVPLLAQATPNTACPLTRGEQAVAFPRGAPPALVAAVNGDLGPYAMPGEPFNATDVVSPGSPRAMRRLVWVRRLGARYVVAYEQGGFAHFWKANAYQMSRDGRSAEHVGDALASSNTLCGLVERLLHDQDGGGGE